MLGKTAYAKGQKLYGTLIAQAEEGYPTYGTDTSNATATEADIAYGKTAYARGQLLIGTAQNMSPDVEEIYGIDDNIQFNTNTSNFLEDPITGEKISLGDTVFSENLNYCVRKEFINNDEYIASYPVNDNGLYIMQSTSIGGQTETKKYRYSKSDLGIEENENITSIKLAPGSGNTTLLYVVTRKALEENPSQYEFFLYIFTYHLRENGVIGKEYENEKEIVNIKEKINMSTTNISNLYIFPKYTNSKEFFLGFSSEEGAGIRYGYLRLYQILINADYTTQTISMKHEYTDLYSYRLSISYQNRELSKDDKFIYRQTYTYNDQYNVIYIDDATNKLYGINIASNGGVRTNYNNVNNRFYTIEDESDTQFYITQHKIILEGAALKDYEEKTIKFTLDNTDLTKYNLLFAHETPVVVLQNQILLFPYNKNDSSLFYCIPVNLNINNISDGDTISLATANLNALSVTFDRNNTVIYNNINNSKLIIFKSKPNIINFGIDEENIVGVKYKGKTFYALEGEQLTAGGPDVRKGKTYIGWMGYPETGIAEF